MPLSKTLQCSSLSGQRVTGACTYLPDGSPFGGKDGLNCVQKAFTCILSQVRVHCCNFLFPLWLGPGEGSNQFSVDREGKSRAELRSGFSYVTNQFFRVSSHFYRLVCCV